VLSSPNRIRFCQNTCVRAFFSLPARTANAILPHTEAKKTLDLMADFVVNRPM